MKQKHNPFNIQSQENMGTTEQCIIKIIYDNCKAHDGFQEGWGFSCLVDLGARKILFDTGADSQAFFSNLQKLNVQCDEITDIVYSHKHWDHVAGFEEIIEKLKPNTRLFLPKKFPSKKLPSAIRSEIVEDFKEIDSGIYSLNLKGCKTFILSSTFIDYSMMLLRLEKSICIKNFSFIKSKAM